MCAGCVLCAAIVIVLVLPKFYISTSFLSLGIALVSPWYRLGIAPYKTPGPGSDPGPSPGPDFNPGTGPGRRSGKGVCASGRNAFFVTSGTGC